MLCSAMLLIKHLGLLTSGILTKVPRIIGLPEDVFDVVEVFLPSRSVVRLIEEQNQALFGRMNVVIFNFVLFKQSSVFGGGPESSYPREGLFRNRVRHHLNPVIFLVDRPGRGH